MRRTPVGQRYLGSTNIVVPGHYAWLRDGTCRAKCFTFRGWHPSPLLDCCCGIYGSLSLEVLVRQYPYETSNIVAVIAVEGETIIGSRGLRTEYARVVAWWSKWGKYRRQARNQFATADQYGDIDSMLFRYGLPREMDEPDDEKGKYWA